MKTGFSVILGHLVDAASVPHHGCATLQVKCPSCHEPVYKAERGKGDGMQHYFCHYPSTDREQVEECERRVARMTISLDLGKEEKRLQRQHLSFFLAITDRMVIEAVGSFARVDEDLIDAMRSNRLLASMLKGYHKIMREKVHTSGLGILFTEREKDRFRRWTRGAFDVNALDPVRQETYGREMAMMLMTPPCAPQLMRSHMAALAATCVYLSNTQEIEPEPWKAPAIQTLETLICDPDLFATPGYFDDERLKSLHAAIGLSQTFLVQILMAIDYGGWLERRSNDPALAGKRWTAPAAPKVPKRRLKPRRTHRKNKGKRKIA